MKSNQVIIHVVLVLLLGCTLSAHGNTPFKQVPESPATPVPLGDDVNNLVFTGTVKRIPDGTALVTNTATYLLIGGNFEGIVGKEVNVIGKIIKEGSIETIKVARAQLANE